MNHDAVDTELPELTDEDVQILDAICKHAATSIQSPSKAIFASYEEILEEHGIDSRHDSVLFRWIIRIVAPSSGRLRRPIDFLGQLRALLEAHGITVVDEVDDAAVGHIEIPRRSSERRRVSFDDARYEETWLSNRSQTFDYDAPDARHNARRHSVARSVSSGPYVRGNVSAPSESAAKTNGPEPEMSDYPSAEELEDAAFAFVDTTLLRRTRQCLHHWYSQTDALLLKQESNAIVAADHDYRLLLRQAWDQWRTRLHSRVAEHQVAAKEQYCEELLVTAPYIGAKRIAWNLWRGYFQDIHATAQPAREHMLRYRYFCRWRTHILDKHKAAVYALVRKYVKRWLVRVARSRQRVAVAANIYEGNLLQDVLMQWLHKVRARRSLRQHQDDIIQRAVTKWRQLTHRARNMQQKATAFGRDRDLQASIRALCQTLKHRLEDREAAERVYECHLIEPATQHLKRYATLLRLLHDNGANKWQRLQHDTFLCWQTRAAAQKKAASHDRGRVLKHVCGTWNDALRIKTLATRIDDRLKAELLYKLMLEERFRLCSRMVQDRLRHQCWQTLLSRLGTTADAEERRLLYFTRESRRRKLTSMVQKMHVMLRSWDDLDRSAVEFGNARLLPKAFSMLRGKAEHVSTMGQWSADAAFFVSTKSKLKIWRERAEQSVQEKRRQAYEQIRTLVKDRVLRSAWNTWQKKLTTVLDMDAQAAVQQVSRTFEKADQALSAMERHVDKTQDMQDLATAHDRATVARSAMLTMLVRIDTVTDMQQTADDFKNDIDATTQAVVFRRLQFAAFAKTRLEDSGTVFQQRHHERNIRRMLRHLLKIALSRRARSQDEGPESPSIRPASRAAARDDGLTSTVNLRNTTTTPAYLRTPARGRRAVKFRGIPTPAPFTPFAFTPRQGAAYDLDTTMNEEPDKIITPFSRRLRASGINTELRPTSIMRSRLTGRNIEARGLATDKSVRFAGSASRFRRARDGSTP